MSIELQLPIVHRPSDDPYTQHEGIKEYSTVADRPAASTFGTGFCRIDGILYSSDGSSWYGDGVCSSLGTRPAASSFGIGSIVDKSTGNRYFSDGTAWYIDTGQASGEPFKVGTKFPFIQPLPAQTRRPFLENNDGLGSGANAFNTPQMQAEVAGTRTSATVFTRTSGTWTANALVGQYAFSYAAGSPSTGVWLPITANTTTTITVSGTLHATGTGTIRLRFISITTI